MHHVLVGLLLVLVGVVHSHAEPSKVRSVTTVVLEDARLPPPDGVRTRLQERLGKDLPIADMETDNDKVILFRVAGGTVMIGLIDRPIPNRELEQACQFAWYWRAACEAVGKHKAHLLVTVLDTRLDAIDAALLATHTMAALMVDANTIAGYWGVNLQSREAFIKQSAGVARQSLPIMLWVNFRMSNDLKAGWAISTRGMDHFGLMEIESKDAPTDGRSLFSLIAQTSAYLISKGPVIKDGETIGESPALNIRVRHAPSFWNEGQTVYCVVYPK